MPPEDDAAPPTRAELDEMVRTILEPARRLAVRMVEATVVGDHDETFAVADEIARGDVTREAVACLATLAAEAMKSEAAAGGPPVSAFLLDFNATPLTVPDDLPLRDEE